MLEYLNVLTKSNREVINPKKYLKDQNDIKL